MDGKWHITVRGVRGSAPRPSPDCMEYGGNTVCISLEREGHTVILDAGTGLVSLGQSIAALRHCGQPVTVRNSVRRLSILLSHFHMDHLLGLYSFAPLSDPGMEIHFYGSRGMGGYLDALVGPPFWPLSLRDFPACLVFHEIQVGESFGLDGLEVSTMAGNHPGGSILYRLSGEGKALVYALDCEADGTVFPALAEFAHGSDLLVWDADFTRQDLHPGWGHSSWEQGLELGRAAGVGRVLMTHYNWEYTDEFLHSQERQAGTDSRCLFAREGMVITL